MAYTLNPFTGKLDANGLSLSTLAGTFLKLDQSTPQSMTGLSDGFIGLVSGTVSNVSETDPTMHKYDIGIGADVLLTAVAGSAADQTIDIKATTAGGNTARINLDSTVFSGNMGKSEINLNSGSVYETGKVNLTAIGYLQTGEINLTTSLMDLSADVQMLLDSPIVKLAQKTTDGFVKTSNSDGTLVIDTSTYLTAETDPIFNAWLIATPPLYIDQTTPQVTTGTFTFPFVNVLNANTMNTSIGEITAGSQGFLINRPVDNGVAPAGLQYDYTNGLIDYSINVGQLGAGVDTSRVGGILRFDTRAGALAQGFYVYAYTAASAHGSGGYRLYVDCELGTTMLCPEVGNTLVGTTTDDAVNKFQVNGSAKIYQGDIYTNYDDVGAGIYLRSDIGYNADGVSVTYYRDGAYNGPRFLGTRYRGDPSTPAAVKNGDELYYFLANGYTGAAEGHYDAKLVFSADDDFSSGYYPARISFQANKGAESYSPTEFIAVSGKNNYVAICPTSGNLLVGTSTDVSLPLNGNIIMNGQLYAHNNTASAYQFMDVANADATSYAYGVFRNDGTSVYGYGYFGIGGTSSSYPNEFFFHTGDSPLAFRAGENSNTNVYVSFGAFSEAMRITNTGNLLIGTTSDDASNKLQVNGNAIATAWVTNGGTSSDFVKGDGSLDSTTYLDTTTAGTTYAKLDGTNQPFTKGIQVTGSTDMIQLKVIANATQTNDILDVFKSDGTTKYFNVDGSGKVGVGISPLVKFHLSLEGMAPNASLYASASDNFLLTGNAVSNVNARLIVAENSDPTSRPQMIFERTRGTLASPNSVTNGDSLGFFGFVGYDGAARRTGASIEAEVDGTVASNQMPTRLLFKTTAAGTLTERMRITSDGKVGIGTTAPSTPLHVKASGPISLFERSNTSTNVPDGLLWNTLNNPDGTNNNYANLGFSSLNGANTNYVYGMLSGIFVDHTLNSMDFAFTARNAGTLGEKMRIKYDGKVGIGTSTPSQKLEVVGNIKTDGINLVSYNDETIFYEDDAIFY